MFFGRHYQPPRRVSEALERVFSMSVGSVEVVEYSRYAQAHLGMIATTRPNRILLAGSGEDFVSDPQLMLHEYFHVLRQWKTGKLTRWRYVVESVRRGYWDNRFEREARDFSAAAVDRYLGYLLHNEAGRSIHEGLA